MAINLGTAYINISASTRGLKSDLAKGFGKASRGAGGAGGKAGEEYGRSFGGKASGMMSRIWDGVGLGIGMKFVDGFTSTVSSAFRGGFDRLMNIQQAEIKFKTLGIDGAKAMESVNAAVDGTKFAISDAADMATFLGASGIEAGKDMEKWLARTADAAQFTNRDFGDMQRVMGKVVAEGRVTGETFQQMPLAAAALADKLGISQEEVRKLASQGKISAEEFGSALDDKIGGAAKDSGASFESMRDNIFTALAATTANILKPLTEAAMPVMESLLGMTKGFRDSIGPIGEAFGEWLQPKAEAFAESLALLPDKITAIKEGVAPATDAFKRLWEGLKENLNPVLDTTTKMVDEVLIPAFGDISDILSTVAGPAFDTISRILSDTLLPVFRGIWEWIGDKLVPVIKTFIDDVFMPRFKKVADYLAEHFLPAFEKVTEFIRDEVAPVVSDFADRVLIPAFERIGAIAGWLFDVMLMPQLEGLGRFLTEIVGPVVVWLWEKVFAPTFANIGDVVETFGSQWATVWGAIQKAAAVPVNFVIETVWNNGLRKVIGLIPGVDEPARLSPVSWGSSGGSAARGKAGGRNISAYADGGFTGPGAKWDPAGIVHAGEYILTRAEVARLGGPNNVDEWKKNIPGYAGGGRVKPVRSGTSGNTYPGHTGLDFPAGRGSAVSATAAGTILHTQKKTTSYGWHVIQSMAGNLKALYAHLSSIAVRMGQTVSAGQLIGGVGNTGNSRGNHLHFEAGPALGRTSTVGTTRNWLRGASMGAGGSVGPGDGVDAGPQDVGALGIPALIAGIVAKVQEQMTSPWAVMMKAGIKGILDDFKSSIIDKPLEAVAEFITGKKTTRSLKGPEAGSVLDQARGGYRDGTKFARSGVHLTGENGPELVDFGRGGQQVINASKTADLNGGRGGNTYNITLPGIKLLSELETFLDDMDAHASTNALLAPAA